MEMQQSHIQRNKFFYIAIAILTSFSASMYLWKIVAVNQANKKAVIEKTAYEEQAKTALLDNSRDFLTLLTKTFVWSIRSEMLRENYDQIDQYVRQFVKEKNILEVLIMDSDGEVVVSSNKRFEGETFGSVYPQSGAELVNDITIDTVGNVFEVKAPIMAFNNQIGMLFMKYEAYDFELNQEAVDVEAIVARKPKKKKRKPFIKTIEAVTVERDSQDLIEQDSIGLNDDDSF